MITAFVEPVVSATGQHTAEVRQACGRLFHRHGFEMPVSLIQVNARSVLMLMPIYCHRDDVKKAARAKALYEKLAVVTLRSEP